MTSYPRTEATRCEVCDLPRWVCVHHQPGDTPGPTPLAVGRRPQRMLPWRFYFDSPSYGRAWAAPVLDDTPLVECARSHDRGDVGLCRACDALVRQLLNDLPALLHDLMLALTKQTSFVARGFTTEDEESPLPYNAAAADALAGVARALPERMPASRLAIRARRLSVDPAYQRDPRAEAWARELSVAARRAHAVIERPDWPVFLGACPQCTVDIFDSRDVTLVECDCGYEATMLDHQRALLDAGEGRLLTVTELVGAITEAKEPVTRDQINGWIRREGLVREKANRPLWRDGELIPRTVYVYRLGDVRTLAQRAERNRVVKPD